MHRTISRQCAIVGAIVCVVIAPAIVMWFTWGDELGARRSYNGHSSSVHDTAFSRSGDLIASAGEDGLRVWRAASGTEILRTDRWAWSAQFLPNDEQIVCAEMKSGIAILQLADGKTNLRLGEPSDWIVLDVSADGQWLAGAWAPYSAMPPDSSSPEYWAIHVWRIADPTTELVLKGHGGPVVGLAFHPSKPLLVSASPDGTRRVWDARSGKQIGQQGTLVPLEKQAPFTGTHSALAFTQKGDHLLLGGSLFRFPELDQERVLWKFGHPYVTSGAISPDGATVLTGHDDGSVRLWDLRTCKELATFRAFLNSSAVYHVEFSPDGKRLVTCGQGQIGGFVALQKGEPANDTTIRIWRVSDIFRGK